MKKSIIWLITIIMGITFASLLYMQGLYMHNIVKMSDEYFSERVKKSLWDVSTSLEKLETAHYLNDFVAGERRFDFSPGGSFPLLNSGGNLIEEMKNSQPPLGLNYQSMSFRDRVRSQYAHQRALLDEVVLNIISETGSLPIQERADSAEVADLLSSTLRANSITQPFEFAVVNRMGTVIYKTAGYNVADANHNVTFVQALFPNDKSNRTSSLKVYFPEMKDYLYSSIRVLVPSFFLTILLLILSIYTIVVAFRQKKLTEMKNDFINNMTHEFKTPISSISLAAQMLNDKSVLKSPKMLEHITSVINDETKRLRFQVEKVLQMSMFDRQKATLRLQEVDVNSVVAGIANTFKLKVERYGGRITTDLDAANALVEVDEMHFTNVIFNLLDNAVKYRDEERPLELSVATRDIAHDRLEIIVADNGIGIRREDLKRVFEKFYRVSTGNRHDVKGFGLGLAYVHKMVSEFGGDIRVESELNKGTKFIIRIPLTKN